MCTTGDGTVTIKKAEAEAIQTKGVPRGGGTGTTKMTEVEAIQTNGLEVVGISKNRKS